jgi:ribonuclease R
VQKSREMKKALLSGSKGAGKSGGSVVKSGSAKAAPSRSEKKPSAPRKGSGSSGAAATSSGKPRKRKAKS